MCDQEGKIDAATIEWVLRKPASSDVDLGQIFAPEFRQLDQLGFGLGSLLHPTWWAAFGSYQKYGPAAAMLRDSLLQN